MRDLYRFRRPCDRIRPPSGAGGGRHAAEARGRLDPDPLGLIDAFLGAPAADAVERTYLAWLVTLAPPSTRRRRRACCWPGRALGERTMAGERLLALLRDTTPLAAPGGRRLHRGPAPACGANMTTQDPGHHRHRLPRRRQDQPGPPPGRARRRQAAGAADQRVRRPRRRPGAARRLRHRGLRRGGRDRARQRLHLLHRGRRLPARHAHDPGPRPRPRPHRDRDLGPGAAQAAGGRVQLARGAQPAHRRRRAGGGRRRGGAGRPLRATIPTAVQARARGRPRARPRDPARGAVRGAARLRRPRPGQQGRPGDGGRPRPRSRPRSAPSCGPGVRLVWTSHGRVDPAVALGLGVGAEGDLASRPSHHDGGEEHGHDEFESFVLPVPPVADPEPWPRRLRAAIRGHDILRVKGFLAVDRQAHAPRRPGRGRAGRALLRPALARGRGAARASWW